jgi:hypothetical protein
MDNTFGGTMKKLVAVATAIGSLTACGGSSSPTAPTAAAANIAGPYNVNVIASSTCAANLPEETRSLLFVATVTQTGTAVELELIAKAAGNPSVKFPGTVSGQTVSFPSFSLTQAMTHGTTLAAAANASVGANASITGTLNGTFQGPTGSACTATNHQFEMVKLCSQPTPTGTALLPCAGI